MLNTVLDFCANINDGLAIGVKIAMKYAKVRAYSMHYNSIIYPSASLTFAVPNTKNDLEEESHNCILMYSQPYLKAEKMSSK